MAELLMAARQPAVAIEEVQVRFRSQISVATYSDEPDQDVRGHQVEPKRRQ
jgi:hypothetical protein